LDRIERHDLAQKNRDHLQYLGPFDLRLLARAKKYAASLLVEKQQTVSVVGPEVTGLEKGRFNRLPNPIPGASNRRGRAKVGARVPVPSPSLISFKQVNVTVGPVEDIFCFPAPGAIAGEAEGGASNY
jgi:hypothetical protein